MKNIYLENGEYGSKAIVTGAWSSDMVNFILTNNVVELELNDGLGWQGDDISFLKDLPQLLAFEIVDLKIKNISPVHFLHCLRELKITTYCKTEIRFSEFPLLVSCAIEWRPKAISLFNCTQLRKLFLNRYDGKDLSLFTNLINLESFAVLGSQIQSLHGIRSLQKITYLRLANLKKLSSLSEIECLSEIEDLDINTCVRIKSIEEIANLKNLRNLALNNIGDLDSLQPLKNLNKLESILFYESTNIVDGDLSCLLDKKNLTKVSFQNRKHYSHKRELILS